MTFAQFVVAAGVDRKWLLNAAALLGRKPRYAAADARWWGLVNLLNEAFDFPLNAAADAASSALARENDARRVTLRRDRAEVATLSLDTFRYGSIATANLSRALVRETPKRRGRRARGRADSVAHAVEYGLD